MFRSQVSTEFDPPATYKFWRHAGAFDYLPVWIGMTAMPIMIAALHHHYYDVMKLAVVAVGIFVGIALMPARRTGERRGVLMYLPSVIAIAAPSVAFAALDQSYDRVLVFVVLAVGMLGVSLLPLDRRAKPTIAIHDDVLTIRMRFHTPAKTETISLGALRQVTVSGPRGNRDWCFDFKNGAKRDFRPHLSREMSEALIAVLHKVKAGRFEVDEVAPLYLEF